MQEGEEYVTMATHPSSCDIIHGVEGGAGVWSGGECVKGTAHSVLVMF